MAVMKSVSLPYQTCNALLRLGTLFLIMLLSAMSVAIAQEHRIALSVGISSYDKLQPESQLEYPALDAEAVGTVFDSLGYDAYTDSNLKSHEFDDLFQSFIDKIRARETTVVIFLSGHGIEIGGQTYLLPSDVPQAKYGCNPTKVPDPPQVFRQRAGSMDKLAICDLPI